MKYTRTKKQIPTIVLSHTLISELCDILDNENKKYNENSDRSYYGVNYKFSNSETYVTESNSTSFLQTIPKDTGSLNLKFESEHSSIEIDIKSSKYYDWNNFSISGEDATWVFGISKQLENIFNKNKTQNHIFYTNKGYLIYALCALCLFLIIGIPLNNYLVDLERLEQSQLPEEEFNTLTEDDKEPTIYGYVISGIISSNTVYMLWPSVFRRIFPILEKEGSSHSKFKEFLPMLIVGIISSIIAGLAVWLFTLL